MALLSVLVVDDDEEFRAWIETAVADLATVIAVATPTEALWKLERMRIDLLVCDLRLATSTTGLDVLAAAKEFWPRVGRILITGHGGEIDCEVSAHAILGKPCDAGALRELLRLVPLLTEVTRSEVLW